MAFGGVGWLTFLSGQLTNYLSPYNYAPIEGSEKVHVLVADNPWCNGHGKLMVTRATIKGVEHLIEYTEVETPFRNRISHLGYVGGVFLDGKAYRPFFLKREFDTLIALIRSQLIDRTNWYVCHRNRKTNQVLW